jgi:mRNA interferase MazF
MNSLNFEQGDIIVADLIFSEQVGAKRRPALVISNTKYNQTSDDIVVLKITSKGHSTEFDVGLDQSHLLSGEIKTESQIMTDNPATVYKKMAQIKIAQITPAKLTEVKTKLKRLYGL